MNLLRKRIGVLALLLCLITSLSGCIDSPPTDVQKQHEAQVQLEQAQATPTDIDFSVKRYLLSRRAYHLNGMEEMANALVCPVVKPLGYVACYAGNVLVGTYVVDGEVVSLSNWLSPESEYYEKNGSSSSGSYVNRWLADVDGTYGDNGKGVFFFTVDGHYKEWSGDYMYSDTPFIVENNAIKVEVHNVK